MPRHHFISYSTVEALDFALSLHDALEAEHVPAWLDKRDVIDGRDWDTQVAEGIRDCATLLFVMTPDSVADTSVCHDEWTLALKYKKSIVPLRCDPTAEAPFRLHNRQYIDFTGGFDAGIARLRQHLRWMKSPEGQLQALKDRLKDAERDLKRACDDRERARIEQEMAQLREDIARQQALVDNPGAVIEAAEASIEARLEIERQPEDAPRTTTKFINPPPMIAPPYFQDRFDETKQIADFLRDDSLRMLTLVGKGGVGKTATICRVLKALEAGRLPDDLGPLSVDGIVYLSTGKGEYRLSVPTLFAGLSKLLSPEAAEAVDAIYRDAGISTADKFRALLGHFPSGRMVVLLDNFEDLIDIETHALRDAEMEEGLRALLAAPQHAVKVIITTHIKPQALMLEYPERQRLNEFEKGLESPYAENILREMDDDGVLDLRDAPDEVLGKVSELTRGFPRALITFVAILRSDRNTQRDDLLADLERWHNMQPVDTPSEGVSHIVEKLVGEAFSRLDSTARLVMQALAIYNRPVPAVAVDYLLQPYTPGLDSTPVLRRLVNMHLVHRDGVHYFPHQTDCAYALTLIPRTEEAAASTATQPLLTQKALFERAAAYYRSICLPREKWKSLHDVKAQLAEIDMRIAAEDHDTAAKLLSELTSKYLLRWGYPLLVLNLYEQLEGKLQDSSDIIDRLHDMGSAYEILGRANDALNSYTAALQIARQSGDEYRECNLLNSLGSIFNFLGQPDSALQHFEEALAIARSLGDRHREVDSISGFGNVFWSRGEWHRAMECWQQVLDWAREGRDRYQEAGCLGAMGGLYLEIGQVTAAIEACTASLDIFRDMGYRLAEGRYLVNLGAVHAAVGSIRQALQCFETGLSIARDIGDCIGEVAHMCNLGIAQWYIGAMDEAAENCERALNLSRQFGYSLGELVNLAALGSIYSCLGNTSAAINYYDEALAIARAASDRDRESTVLGSLGYIHLVRSDIQEAARLGNAAIEIADEIGSVPLQVEVRRLLALTSLFSGDLSTADYLVTEALDFDYLPRNHYVQVLAGIVALRKGENARAQEMFEAAIIVSDDLLGKDNRNYDAWDAKGLAAGGLALVSTISDDYLRQATEAFQSARAITSAPGLVAEVLLQFDVLAHADTAGLLVRVRSAAAGE